MADDDPLAALHERLKAAPASGQIDVGAIWEKIGGAKSAEASAQSQKLTDEANKPSIAATLWGSLQSGLGDVYKGAEGLGVKMLTGIAGRGQDLPRQHDVEMGQRESAIAQSPQVQAHPTAAAIGRFGGNMLGTAPMGMVPGAGALPGIGRAALGAGQGAVASGVLSGGDPTQTAMGAGLGGGLAAGGAIIGPRIQPAFERIATELPQLADLASGKLGRTAEAFQNATANYVLDPIREMVGKGVKVGDDLINHVGDKLRDAYNKVTPHVTFRAAAPDPYTAEVFKDELKNLSAKVESRFEKDWDRLVRREITDRLDANSNMSGKAFKEADSNIGDKARRFLGPKADPEQEEYGRVLRELQAKMRESLAVHNPQQSKALRDADQAWSRYVRMEEAAGRGIKSNSEFMPNDLLYASRRGYSNREYSHGHLPMQAFGRAGNDLLSGNQPNWHKYLADAVGAGIGAGVGGMAGHAVGGIIGAGLGGAAGGGAGAAVGAGARRMTQGPIARGIGRTIESIGPPSAAAATRKYQEQRTRDRLKAAGKMSEIKNQRWLAMKRGNFEEVESLGSKLAEAHADYRELGGTA